MIRGFNFRLLYRVAFVSFCVAFVCSYHGGSSRYDKRVETQSRKFKTGPAEHDPGGSDTKEKTEFKKKKMEGKGNFLKCKNMCCLGTIIVKNKSN